MSLLFATDFHQGPDIRHKVSLWGSLADDLHFLTIDFCQREGIGIFMNGGDQSSYNSDITKHHQAAERSYQRAQEFRGFYAHVVGNHEPTQPSWRDKLIRKSYSINQNAMPSTKIIVAQPRIKVIEKAGKKRYRYKYGNKKDGNTEIIGLIDDITPDQCNLIIGSHFAFDRSKRKIGNKSNKKSYYVDNTHDISEKLRAISRFRRSIVTLHGHEHCFSISSTGNLTSLVMPSISQEDVDQPNRPCGLFAVVSECLELGISIEFKKITLPNIGNTGDAKIETVSPEYMHRYSKPSLIGG
ncbi:MAG: hypothetical protein GW903_04600 [Alphaproteobacteria bacterium]|nr:hypothetical protein [Alphaproteobacteria bacterium]NCQ88250.1 hypothetical protein [Alphaproteobacteria bacterium]NCT05243.1 hypothetical protein [Alphaproteobacteria bacterium]